MIKLKIEEYCNNCVDFEAEQKTVVIHADYLDIPQHNIMCKHANKCKELKKYLESKAE